MHGETIKPTTLCFTNIVNLTSWATCIDCTSVS